MAPFRVRPPTDRPLYKSLARSIRSSIEAGVLQAGDRLPAQDEIAREARVHVGTVNRAINLLIRERLLIKGSNGDRVRVAGARSEAGRSGGPWGVRLARDHAILTAEVIAIEGEGECARLRARLLPDQPLLLTVSRSLTQPLGLTEGRRVVVDFACPRLGLSST